MAKDMPQRKKKTPKKRPPSALDPASRPCETFDAHNRDLPFDCHDPEAKKVVSPPLPEVPEAVCKHKISCKGIQKKRNKDRLTFEHYVDVMTGSQGVHRG